MGKSAANRGKATERAIQDIFAELNRAYARFDWSRIYDTRAARSFLPARPGDYEFFYPGVHGLLEAKELEHDYRLPRDKIPQLGGLIKRELAGGLCLVVTHHTNLGAWRRIPASWLHERAGQPSWDLREFPTMKTAREALDPIILALAEVGKL